MGELTFWHYTLLFILVTVFSLSAVLARRTGMFVSVMLSVLALLFFAGGFGWYSLNQSLYKVQLVGVKKERNFQTEQVVFSGMVKNTGQYPVSSVEAAVTINNSSDRASSGRFAKPTAFADYFGSKGKDEKPQTVVARSIIAHDLGPGESKPFRIQMDYPPYFGRSTYDIDATAH